MHIHTSKGLIVSARKYTCALGLREAPTAAQAAHQGTTTSASSPASFHNVIQVQLLPRRALVHRTSSVYPAWTNESTLRRISTAYTNGMAIATQSTPDTNQHRAETSKSEGTTRAEQPVVTLRQRHGRKLNRVRLMPPISHPT